jgi:hypothetical protein
MRTSHMTSERVGGGTVVVMTTSLLVATSELHKTNIVASRNSSRRALQQNRAAQGRGWPEVGHERGKGMCAVGLSVRGNSVPECGCMFHVQVRVTACVTVFLYSSLMPCVRGAHAPAEGKRVYSCASHLHQQRELFVPRTADPATCGASRTKTSRNHSVRARAAERRVACSLGHTAERRGELATAIKGVRTVEAEHTRGCVGEAGAVRPTACDRVHKVCGHAQHARTQTRTRCTPRPISHTHAP